MDHADQILAISRITAFAATGHPGRPYVPSFAKPMIPHNSQYWYECGLRFHPELATREPVSGPPSSAAQQRNMGDAHAALMGWLKQQNPAMHDRVAAAQNDPMRKALLLAEIQREHPEIMTKGQEILAAMGSADAVS
jgi:hypothetical protein